MFRHGPPGSLGILAVEGAYDAAMLLQSCLALSLPRQHDMAATVQLRLRNVDRPPQPVQMADVGDVAVELVVCHDGFGEAAALDRARVLQQKVVQRLGMTVVHAMGSLRRALHLQCATNEIGLFHFGPVDMRSPGARLRNHIDEMLIAQFLDRLSYGCARDIEFGRNQLLIKNVAWRNASGQDEMADEIIDLVAQGPGTVKATGVKFVGHA